MRHYHSTRNKQEKYTASQAIINGLADDGGLYICALNHQVDLDKIMNCSYQEKAYEIFKLFLDDFSEEEIKECISKAYTNTFASKNITPITYVKDDAILELFHGPTSAFKDVALQILPHFMQTAKKKQNIDQDIVILTATSGDTGKAAMEGFADVDGCKIFVFFPEKGVSVIQKKQMQTQRGNNVKAIGVEGNFDDCQRTVKEIFMDEDKPETVMFSSANSINIGRLIPQIVYYFEAYSQMINDHKIQLGDLVNFAVPTGNFGNILAGYIAKKIGLPIAKLICASNENNVLTDFIQTGIYDANREFMKTNSPSMDILISSNLERLLYYVSEDTDEVSSYMKQLKENHKYEIKDEYKQKIQSEFYSGMCDEETTCQVIRQCYEDNHYLMDTHTAVAYHVTQLFKEAHINDYPTVILSTASPYKFCEAVLGSLTSEISDSEFKRMYQLHSLTQVKIPEKLAELESLQELHKDVVKIKDMKTYVMKQLGDEYD